MRAAVFLVSAAIAVGAAGTSVRASATADPADLAFWQAIQNSTSPAEYQAYLDAFPNGRFAALARVRVKSPPAAAQAEAPAAAGQSGPAGAPPAAAATTQAPTAAAPPAAAPAAGAAQQGATAQSADLGPVAGGGRVKLLAKPTYQLGEPIKIRFAGLPRGDNHTLRVIPAESPNAFQQPLQKAWIYPSNRDGGAADSQTGQMDVQTLAPGNYQAIIVSTIFNNANREEIVARAAFTVD